MNAKSTSEFNRYQVTLEIVRCIHFFLITVGEKSKILKNHNSLWSCDRNTKPRLTQRKVQSGPRTKSPITFFRTLYPDQTRQWRDVSHEVCVRGELCRAVVGEDRPDGRDRGGGGRAEGTATRRTQVKRIIFTGIIYRGGGGGAEGTATRRTQVKRIIFTGIIYRGGGGRAEGTTTRRTQVTRAYIYLYYLSGWRRAR